LLRTFDHTEDLSQPWRGCPEHIATAEAGGDCRLFGNRLSGSIVWKGMPPNRANGNSIPIFGPGSGTIYNPSAVSLNCAYLGDSGSRGKSDGCGRIFCDEQPADHDPWCGGMPYRPTKLMTMLEGFKAKAGGSYNEIIITSSTIDEHLPGAVDAFFYVEGQDGAAAKLAHRSFKEEFGAAAATVPLVRLNVHQWDQPFSQG
tara:strand:- start:50 stop:652 length:603 start_codon:yes stop_codon:yes gene_type:complete